MSNYNMSINIDYPIERVFKVFIDLNKKEIPKFNDKNPTEVSYKKVIKQVGKQKIEMETSITGYEKDKLYEVTNKIGNDKYISKYEFKKIDSNSTEILLSETQEMMGISSSLMLMFQKLSAKKKLKAKMQGIKDTLEQELERRDGKLNKSNSETE